MSAMRTYLSNLDDSLPFGDGHRLHFTMTDSIQLADAMFEWWISPMTEK